MSARVHAAGNSAFCVEQEERDARAQTNGNSPGKPRIDVVKCIPLRRGSERDSQKARRSTALCSAVQYVASLRGDVLSSAESMQHTASHPCDYIASEPNGCASPPQHHSAFLSARPILSSVAFTCLRRVRLPEPPICLGPHRQQSCRRPSVFEDRPPWKGLTNGAMKKG